MQICQLCHKNFKILQKGRKKKLSDNPNNAITTKQLQRKKTAPKISANMGTELRITATKTLGADDHVVRNVNN